MEIKTQEMLEEHLKQININEFDDFWNMNILKQDLSLPYSYYIIAKCEEKIVGFAGINIILEEAHIANIAVKKDMRNLRYWFKVTKSTYR